MRNAQIKVYSYAELSEDAKDTAKNYINSEHFWGAECIDSIKSFASQFKVMILSYKYGAFDIAEISHNAENSNFRRFTLKDAEKLPEYPTGYYLDYNIREKFISEFKRTGNARIAFDNAMDYAIKECRSEWESQFDDGIMADYCELNDYEFTANGKLF